MRRKPSKTAKARKVGAAHATFYAPRLTDLYHTMKPTLAITMGDVNGIGPEIIAKAFADPCLMQTCMPVVFGNAEIYATVKVDVQRAPEPFVLNSLDDLDGAPRHTLPFLECGVETPPYRPGQLSSHAGRCAMQWLEHAVRLALAESIDGIVTCPINKEGIHAAGYTVQGHTDFIANMTGAKSYRMCLFTDALRIIHLTGHLPLKEALDLVKKDRIAESIQMAHDVLVRLCTPRRRIAVAGLNPHAGEAGAFGDEERAEIAPAIAACKDRGIDCHGPISPDAVYRQALEGHYDAVIAMYHDQGHIPLKLVAMDEGVNVTLGIPIVRTSVDHGTAYDIAGRNQARAHSLRAAILLAAQLVSAPSEVAP